MERNGGLHSILTIPAIYSTFQRVVGADKYRQRLVDDYLDLNTDGTTRVLDAGCGPGSMRPHLRNADYVGFDVSAPYIESARELYPDATFFCGDANQMSEEITADFDRVVAVGVLHHLADDDAATLVELARNKLRPGGKFVAVDPTFVAGQSRLSRLVISGDRGQAVRTPKASQELAGAFFDDVYTYVRHDLIRIPYTHLITVAT